VSLEAYRKKRRFGETPEPPGGATASAGAPRFVVQEHHATRVHWDFRLEMEGALRSWAVPKGPSLDPADKRLAVLVEDHPIEYGDFEGIIPEGNYGAGTVMLWDRGTYACAEGDPAAAFRRGKMTLTLDGQKLRGEFHFVQTRRSNGRDWLLFKGHDEFAAPGYTPFGTRSVASGRTIEEVAADQDARWTSGDGPREGREAPSTRGGQTAPPARVEEAPGGDPFPEPFRPMLAQTADGPFSDPAWLFEIKWDGVRALAFLRRRGPAQEVVLYSRTLHRQNAQYPEIVEALAALDVDSAVLDGEIFAPDDEGRPDFPRLQQRINLTGETDVREAAGQIGVLYAVFDCLYLHGRDLRMRPLSERRRALEGLVLPPRLLRSDAVEGDGETLFHAARQHGLEGIIAKRASSVYEPGVRSPQWLKIKVRQRLEAVVGGFTRGKGHRKGTFGALVLGQYDPRTGALVHIGQTGGGLRDSDLCTLRKRLEPLETKDCPFVPPPRLPQPVTWVRPEVVVEVEYSEFTPDGMLRAPVYIGVRDDVTPREARREAPAPAPASLPSPGAEAAPRLDAAPPAAPASPGADRTPKRRSARPPEPAPQVVFTNLDKVFFPELGLTKGDVIEYYRRIAPYILPHLRDRPLTLRRWPDGIHGSDFFQKDVEDAPPFVRVERIWSEDGRRDIRQAVCNNEATLLWLAQMGCIELHPWFSRITPAPGRGRRRPGTTFAGSDEAVEASVLNRPDFLVFDIDPFLLPEGAGLVKRHGEFDPDYTRRGFDAARQAALWLGAALEEIGLRAFLKTSGKTGLHVLVPVVREYTYAQTHAFAKTMAGWLTDRHPDALTTAWPVHERVGRVFLDYNQNARAKTLASIYSLRPVPQATVSMPVTWEELRAGVDPLQWTAASVFARLERVGDLWAEILHAAQPLAPAETEPQRGGGPRAPRPPRRVRP
jgi:bifunctional non-homologous end joining protein LigD